MKDRGYYDMMSGMYCIADVYPIRAICSQCQEPYLETDPAEIRRIHGEVQHGSIDIIHFCTERCERKYEKSHFFYRLRKRKRKRRQETACDESPYW